jgi:Zn-dependent M28 family amino/carboxypeptidase
MDDEVDATGDGRRVGGVDAAAIGRASLDTRPWTLLTDLTAIGNRMVGSDGERRAADLLTERLASAGAEAVRRDPFDLPVWARGETTLELTAPVERAFEAIALPYSPSGRVAGPLVDVGDGTPDEVDGTDVEGAVAVASTTTPAGERFVHRMEKFGHAIDAGAVGFVFANHRPGQLPPTGTLRTDGEAAVPAVGVSKETGEWLRRHADRDGRVEYRVSATTDPGDGRNVLGRIPATSETDETGADGPGRRGDGGADTGASGEGGGSVEADGHDRGTEPGETGGGHVLLMAHYDAHDVGEGALDNGCGVAVVLTALRLLAAPDTHLPSPVEVALVSGEEVGLVGSERLASRGVDDVRAVVNVDGAGRHRDLVALTHTSAATEAVVESVSDRTRQPIRVTSEPHPFSDHWPFVRRGVPAVQFHSDGGERGRGVTHTRADTRDKVDDRNLRAHAVVVALVVAALARRPTAELPRIDAADLEAAFREADFEQGMRAAGMWPDEWRGADRPAENQDGNGS